MRFVAAAALTLVLSLPAAAADSFEDGFQAAARGTFAGEFLGLGAGARAAAMGGAYSAVVDEASAVYWNPAAMTRVARRSATLMHAAALNASSYEYGSYVQNEGVLGAFGFGAQYFSPGRFVRTNEAGVSVGNVTPYDMALSWSYAREVGGFSLGASAKVVDSRIVNSASAGALDVGLLSPALLDDRLRLAFTAVNFGGDTMVFDQAGAKLPLAVRGGGAYQLLPSLLVSADAVFGQSDRPYGALGAEYRLGGPGYRLSDARGWGFAARAGLNTQTIGSVDGFTAVAMGFGVSLHGAAIDYAFAPFGGLGQVHRLSITCAF